LSRRTLGQLAFAAGAAAAPQRTASFPNILFLISDDQTWRDLGCYGNRSIRTPSLDRLAQAGARFSNCFVASPQCSPNRSAIFTGCTPHLTNTSRLHTPMPPWERTYLEVLKERGYFAGAFGKVHQGPQFDKRWDFYLPGTDFAVEKFFDKLPGGKPFFLHVGFTDPHRPYQKGTVNPPHDPAKVEVPAYLPDLPAIREDLALYYDEISRMDSDCGRILDVLQQRGLADNTLVIFTADNGMPFPRAKGTCYDAGIRVPLLARWPGRIKPGSVYEELISHVDLSATWAELAGSRMPDKAQGRSFLPLMTAGAYTQRTEVYSERNWHDTFDPIRSVRTSRYKLIFNGVPQLPYRPSWDIYDSPSWEAMTKAGRRPLPAHNEQLFAASRPVLELYDVEKDQSEFNNLAGSPEHEEVMTDLKMRLGRWMGATYDYLPPLSEGKRAMPPNL
jgi:arylsulfatase A-like enzyme